MIVLNPPPPPPNMTLIKTAPHHQAIEAAIQIARLRYWCEENTDPVSWLRLMIMHDAPEATFIVQLARGNVLTFDVADGSDLHDGELAEHEVVDGAVGVLHFAALLSSLATP